MAESELMSISSMSYVRSISMNMTYDVWSRNFYTYLSVHRVYRVLASGLLMCWVVAFYKKQHYQTCFIIKCVSVHAGAYAAVLIILTGPAQLLVDAGFSQNYILFLSNGKRTFRNKFTKRTLNKGTLDLFWNLPNLEAILDSYRWRDQTQNTIMPVRFVMDLILI